jgi:hypothetical protein
VVFYIPDQATRSRCKAEVTQKYEEVGNFASAEQTIDTMGAGKEKKSARHYVAIKHALGNNNYKSKELIGKISDSKV